MKREKMKVVIKVVKFGCTYITTLNLTIQLFFPNPFPFVLLYSLVRWALLLVEERSFCGEAA